MAVDTDPNRDVPSGQLLNAARVGGTSPMRAEIITEPLSLAALEPEWWALFRRASGPTPFSSPAWLIPWWDAFAPGRLFVVAIRSEAMLVALAPLYIETGPLGRRLLPLGIGISDYMDVLIDPDRPEAGEMLFATLASTAQEWDRWCAEEARPGAIVLSLAPPQGWDARTEPQSACPVLCLAGGPDLAVPAHQRRKWRMAKHRTARRAWSMSVATRETVADDLDHLSRLHAARWESRGEAGVLADPAVQDFHRRAAPRLLEADLLRLLVLRIDGAIAAVHYGLQHDRLTYGYLNGFDPAFAFESPGTFLLGEAVDTAAGEGAEAFHFLRGQESYKYLWGASDVWNSRRIFTVRP